MALLRPGIPLANPGVVYVTTPGSPVTLAHASAMWTAAASCRVSMMRKSMSARASRSGKLWSPASVNTVETPAALRVSPIR